MLCLAENMLIVTHSCEHMVHTAVMRAGRVLGGGGACVPTWGVVPCKHGFQAAFPSKDIQPISGGHQHYTLPFRGCMLVHAGHGILPVLQLKNTLGYPLFLVLLVYHHFVQNPSKRANQDVSAEKWLEGAFAGGSLGVSRSRSTLAKLVQSKLDMSSAHMSINKLRCRSQKQMGVTAEHDASLTQK